LSSASAGLTPLGGRELQRQPSTMLRNPASLKPEASFPRNACVAECDRLDALDAAEPSFDALVDVPSVFPWNE
jgi:hypothetical protein